MPRRRRPQRPDSLVIGLQGADYDTVDLQQHRAAVVERLKNEPNLITKSLVACVENGRSLRVYTELASEAVKDLRDRGGRQVVWKDAFGAVFDKAVELSDPKALKEALELAHEVNEATSASPRLKRPWLNCTALTAACLTDNAKMAKMLLVKGYRLKSAHFMDPPKRSTLKELPFRVFRHTHNDQDEVEELRILRAMSRPCYILGQFTVVHESYKSKNGGKCPGCEPIPYDNKQHNNNNNNSISNSSEVELTSLVDIHLCPHRVKFIPASGCADHPACSDPVFHCFEIGHTASRYSKLIPEYREEYKSISRDCNELAVALLDLCKDTAEVERLLENSTGCAKYFGRDVVRSMRFPRLQMAVMNNHKSFVVHQYCQQVLR